MSQFEALRESIAVRGNANCRVTFVSDSLSQKAKARLSNCNTTVLTIDDATINALKSRVDSSVHPLGKIAKPFIVAWALQELRLGDSPFLYLDPDVLVQGDLGRIASLSATGWFMRREETNSDANPHTSRRLNRAVTAGLLTVHDTLRERREFNTGVFGAPASLAQEILGAWKELMIEPSWNRFRNPDTTNDSWHDQDYFRAALRFYDGLRVQEFGRQDVVHLCVNGHKWIRTLRGRFVDLARPWGLGPTIVHFAGGSWRRFPGVSSLYLREQIEVHS